MNKKRLILILILVVVVIALVAVFFIIKNFKKEKTVEEEKNTSITYENGKVFYFNPVTAQKCIASEAVSTTGTKDGCMKWYAFLTDEESDTVNLLLDHNTTALVAWNADGGETPDTVTVQLQTDITNWETTVKEGARLISATEVNEIAPRTDGTSWNVNGYSTRYYLHNGTTTQYKGDAGTNTYAWLFDNTYNCTTYGCNVAETNTYYGYWTLDYAGMNISGAGRAWYIDCNGILNYSTVTSWDINGVRPVITVSKSIFE